MPFKSNAQRRWMHTNEPSMARRWQSHTPKGKNLPERVPKKKKKRTEKSASLSLIGSLGVQAAYDSEEKNCG